MPVNWHTYRQRPPTCGRAYTWSTYRGGCRFAPGHDGPCKPTGGKR